MAGKASRRGASRETFFFSCRRRHTRSYGDWSSDVCSSDLDERAIERDYGVAAAGQCVVAEPNAVQNPPCGEREGRRDEVGAGPRYAFPQAVAEHEREEDRKSVV